jgi:hypothetical protein
MRRSRYGLEIEDFLEFESGSYQDENGNEVSYEGLFLDTVLITPAWRKDIVTTSLVGRKGSVKEYITEGDAALSIRGLLVSDSLHQKPKDQIRKLKKILTAPVPLKIICPFLNELGIYEIVVESYGLPQREGSANTQPFDITASEDTPLEITLENEK